MKLGKGVEKQTCEAVSEVGGRLENCHADPPGILVCTARKGKGKRNEVSRFCKRSLIVDFVFVVAKSVLLL
ncbi:hypothetical protein [Schinkia azotoformans]|uniref:hypothetical protein n=1 Tax=Schinkia azotoformans TaxID=1454 RepID=UPI000B1BACD6|nr:hypothetical protein [Schinkia azotoformans]MEC1696826.1 hypothetical protein [Schinkia azotoformans]MEC1718160.1 hypothetical protein [Schinkia azotoformans]MEC1726641.1 hypothetical protein [Schinkia azotoformans]MEC1782193.1 hypothetical protein [Schinkia azotoformans]MED4375064.1 hypothetical protein [Schinkia azotoformans]